jgi:hypothetical protein
MVQANHQLMCASYLCGSTDYALQQQRQSCAQLLSCQTEPPLTNSGIEWVEAPDGDPTDESSAFDQMLAEAAMGKVQVLAIADGTRLSCDPQTLVRLMWACQKLDVVLIFADDGFCTDPKLHQQLFGSNGF